MPDSNQKSGTGILPVKGNRGIAAHGHGQDGHATATSGIARVGCNANGAPQRAVCVPPSVYRLPSAVLTPLLLTFSPSTAFRLLTTALACRAPVPQAPSDCGGSTPPFCLGPYENLDVWRSSPRARMPAICVLTIGRRRRQAARNPTCFARQIDLLPWVPNGFRR